MKDLAKLLLAIIALISWRLTKADEWPSDYISVTDYGATSNDTSDDTAAIVNTINAAKAQGKKVYVPAGRFNHREFTLNGVFLIGSGDASVLHAPDYSSFQIFLTGAGPSIKDVRLTMGPLGPRNNQKRRIYGENATNFLVENVTMEGSGGGGMTFYFSHTGKIIRNQISNTNSDAIHVTNGSHDITIAGNTVRNPGDDMFAVVSYGCSELVYNILIENNDAMNQPWGRGATVIGGRNVTIRGNRIDNTYGAGISLASEPSFHTCGVTDIKVEGNQLGTRGTVSGGVHQGGLLLSGFNGAIQTVLVKNNTISNSQNEGVEIEGSVNTVSFDGTKIENPAATPWRAGGSAISCWNTALNGDPFMPPGCTNQALSFPVTGYPGDSSGISFPGTTPAP